MDKSGSPAPESTGPCLSPSMMIIITQTEGTLALPHSNSVLEHRGPGEKEPSIPSLEAPPPSQTSLAELAGGNSFLEGPEDRLRQRLRWALSSSLSICAWHRGHGYTWPLGHC